MLIPWRVKHRPSSNAKSDFYTALSNWLENLRKAKLKEEKVAVGVVVDLKFYIPWPLKRDHPQRMADTSNHHFSRAKRNFRGKKDHLSS